MWDCFRINVNERVSEQLNVSIFARFDVISSVENERHERVDAMIDSRVIENQKFWLLDVAKRINEASDASEQMTADFFLILYADSSVEIRKSKFLTDSRTWWWRMCSWSLLLKLNIWLQRRHVVEFFVDFDLVSDVEDERFERFRRAIVSNAIADSNFCFWCFADEAENFCEANDVFSISHIKLTTLIERWEFSTCFWAFRSRWCAWRASCWFNLSRSASWHERDSK